MLGYRVARVLVIFQLPRFCHEICSTPLAYVELFNSFSLVASPLHHLASTKPLLRNGARVRKILPISKIRMTCQLVPEYAKMRLNRRITPSTDVISFPVRFFLNRHSSYYFWSLMDHWRRVAQAQR